MATRYVWNKYDLFSSIVKDKDVTYPLELARVATTASKKYYCIAYARSLKTSGTLIEPSGCVTDNIALNLYSNTSNSTTTNRGTRMYFFSLGFVSTSTDFTSGTTISEAYKSTETNPWVLVQTTAGGVYYVATALDHDSGKFEHYINRTSKGTLVSTVTKAKILTCIFWCAVLPSLSHPLRI